VLGPTSPQGEEHYQSLETAVTSVGQHYLEVDLLHSKFCICAVF
jgi:hypothetical protein